MLVTEVDEPLNVVPPVFIKVKPPLEAACHFNPVLVELSATRLLDPECLEQSCAIVLDTFR